MAETQAKPVDAMDLSDLMQVAIDYTVEPNRAHLLRAVILGRQAERRVGATLEAAEQFMPIAVGIVAIASQRKAARRATVIALMRARRLVLMRAWRLGRG